MGRPGSATTLHYNGSPRTLGCLRAYTFHHNGSPRTVFSGGQAAGRRAGGRAGKLTVARAGGRSRGRSGGGGQALGRSGGRWARAIGRLLGGRWAVGRWTICRAGTPRDGEYEQEIRILFTAEKTDPNPDPPFLELMSGDPYEGEFFDNACSRASLFSSSECPFLVRAF